MRYSMILSLCIPCIGAFACSGSDDKPSSTASTGASSYSAISDSIAHPTGTLDKSNAASIGTEYEKISTSSAAGRRVQGGSSANQEITCPAGGKYTVAVDANQSSGQATLSYNQCCYEASCCINGGGTWYYSNGGSSTYSYCGSYNLSVTCGGDSGNATYEGCFNLSGEWVYVVRVNGKTYSVSGNLSDGSGTLEVTAANGSFTCTYSKGSGSCTGSAGNFTF